MEASTALRSAPISLKFGDCGSRSCVVAARRRNFSSDSKSNLSSGFLKGRCSISLLKQGKRQSSLITFQRKSGIRASSTSSSDHSDSSSPIAPLQLESPIGQFLSEILYSHPHLLPAAVDQQLEQLQLDREAQKEQDEPPASDTDIVLYRRIAEVKANERKRALEEILYALVVQKFVEAGVSLVPSLSPSSGPSGKVDQWPSEDDKLKTLHSPEAYEMINNHLSLILGQRLDDRISVAPISKLRVGQVYAASIMYGYFLKRVDQRFQLEKSMKTLKESMSDESQPSDTKPHPEVSSLSSSPSLSGIADRIKPCKLRTYVMSFDAETLQSYAAIRSKEALGIIEKHTEALFGRPEIAISPQGTIDSSKDEIIKISFGGLKRLVLEAVTFGSFLWDVESYVDSRYHFVAN
ncbi:UV-B-induced protein At3g17800, chloroplastic-like [Asparagus officinalis]|uniref:UV-B-induced protein At3g17800, chloroplastic-like n=1 Tax=Asparagus officinalis TaxID=4686 RepID=UPI00098E56DE|nr:UV-B-induced protein At3g17800, chloroplastic-like [Asparagus officinalis]XP_020241455.1 UV-B-induced protein At3g17800, chloroplastic-like [Asparagus officinalis]